MDFIVRDNYHTGAGYGDVDIFRIIYTLKIYDNNILINITALSALEVFLISRVQSFRNIYFHKVSRSAQIMLSRAIDLAADDLGLTDFKDPYDYLKWDDYVLWTELLKNEKSRPIIQDLQRRNMLKREKPFRLYSSETHDIRFFKKPNHRNTVIKVVINKKDRDDWIIEPLYNAPFNRLVKDIAELIHQLIKHDVLNNISINTHSEMTFDNDPSWKNHEYIHYATSEKSQVQVGLAHISLDNAIRNYRYLCWISYRGIAQIDQLSAYELEPLI